MPTRWRGTRPVGDQLDQPWPALLRSSSTESISRACVELFWDFSCNHVRPLPLRRKDPKLRPPITMPCDNCHVGHDGGSLIEHTSTHYLDPSPLTLSHVIFANALESLDEGICDLAQVNHKQGAFPSIYLTQPTLPTSSLEFPRFRTSVEPHLCLLRTSLTYALPSILLGLIYDVDANCEWCFCTSGTRGKAGGISSSRSIDRNRDRDDSSTHPEPLP
jgi:hypothetical protein